MSEKHNTKCTCECDRCRRCGRRRRRRTCRRSFVGRHFRARHRCAIRVEMSVRIRILALHSTRRLDTSNTATIVYLSSCLRF